MTDKEYLYAKKTDLICVHDGDRIFESETVFLVSRAACYSAYLGEK